MSAAKVRAVIAAVALTGTAMAVAPDVSTALADGPSIQFAPPLVTPAVGQPLSVALTELSAGAGLDLVVANYSASSATVLIRNGDGSFSVQNSVDLPSPSLEVAVGDLDGDSVPDLVAADEVSGGVVVLLGLGGHEYDAAVSYPAAVGSQAQALALADVDGDGKLDVVTVNFGTDSASVLLGNGDGTLGSSTDYPVGAYPTDVVIEDVVGDESLDLVVPNAVSDSLSVLPGDGSGGFGPAIDIATPAGPQVVAVADLNADGVLDLAVTSVGSDVVSVYLADGSGGFGTATDYATGEDPRHVVAADFDGDADLDLAIANTNANSVSVLSGDGLGGFGARQDIDVGGGPWGLAAGDIDGDSLVDLVASSGVSVAVLLNVTGVVRAPRPPTDVSAQPGSASATVTWSAPWDGGSPILGYIVTPSVGHVSQGPRDFASAATTQTVTGLTNGTTYQFQVQAYNAAGVSDFSIHSTTVVPQTPVPSQPTIGTATGGNGSATVRWVAPLTDNGVPITGYVVTPYIGYYPLQPVAFASTATTQMITGLTNGTTHRFKVAAVNAAGAGPTSSASNPVTPVAPGAPGAPTIGTATPGNGRATVSWTAPASDGGSAITGYAVTPYFGYWSGTPRTFDSTATSQTVTGLTNGWTYRFRVQAINAVGTGGPSEVTNRVTPMP